VTCQIKNAVASFSGVGTCGSVHTCPVCQPSIRIPRAEFLQRAGDAWEADSRGLFMLTLTMRHYRRQPLDDLVEVQRAAWREAFGQNRGRRWRRAMERFGIRGYVRAWETTHRTANGWHVHYHVLYFADRPLGQLEEREPETAAELLARHESEDQAARMAVWRKAMARADVQDEMEWLSAAGRASGALWDKLRQRRTDLTAELENLAVRDTRPRVVRELEDIAYEVWANAVTGVGGYTPSRAHGARIDAPNRGEAGQLARYLMKDQDKQTWSIADELVRQDLKQGLGDSRTPMQIARDAVAGDTQSAALWREFEPAATGIRSLYWSQGMKALLAELGVEPDDRTDDQLADAEEDAKPLAMVLAGPWYRHVVAHPGRDLAMLHAAELTGQAGVRILTETWGLIWGVDVLEPESPPPAGLLTADEVLTKLRRADLTARAEVWRQEFDRQDRENRLGRVVYRPNDWSLRAKAQREDGQQAVVSEETLRDRAARDFQDRRRASRAARADELAAALARFRAANAEDVA
jgi:hypothetical protein